MILGTASKPNAVLSSALLALSRTVSRVDDRALSDIELIDAVMLQECAAVIARSSSDELFSAMKQMKTSN